MTLYIGQKKQQQKECNYVNCNTIKSHNTVYAHTALLKAAELLSSVGSWFHNDPDLALLSLEMFNQWL